MKERLVRFDWAMKKLLRNKANFEILEGFLSELIKQDITIEKILESESNKSTFDDKHNRVDLLTETENGELLLIELQVESQYDYFHRMVYGTSKLVTDNMSSGFSYEMIRRVISINIVYFDLGHGQDYVYKGTTQFKGIHKDDLLELSPTQKNRFKNIENVANIFPEYYILKVTEFDNLAKNTLDEWIYFLKNSEIKSEFSAKGLKKAAEELDILKLSKEERADYERYIEDWRVGESSIKTAWFKGEMKGRIEGKLEGKIEGKTEIALEMLKDGEPYDKIAKYTGLTDDEIETFKKRYLTLVNYPS
ncbi:MAG: Rpn family recombination-promoting nuclease/putative transposase [Desulfamplus sp.]|nr:Rpn family recombination-promoting nuclease/putative transposase [Desulfamplus sp.]